MRLFLSVNIIEPLDAFGRQDNRPLTTDEARELLRRGGAIESPTLRAPRDKLNYDWLMAELRRRFGDEVVDKIVPNNGNTITADDEILWIYTDDRGLNFVQITKHVPK